MDRLVIYCVDCRGEIEAELVHGKDVYPHRPDLAELPFWQCPYCGNFVGCHHKSHTPLKPLGVIANKQIKMLRVAIHKQLDGLWKDHVLSRRECYMWLSKQLGYQYHSGEIKSIKEAKRVLELVQKLNDKRDIIEVRKCRGEDYVNDLNF